MNFDYFIVIALFVFHCKGQDRLGLFEYQYKKKQIYMKVASNGITNDLYPLHISPYYSMISISLFHE